MKISYNIHMLFIMCATWEVPCSPSSQTMGASCSVASARLHAPVWGCVEVHGQCGLCWLAVWDIAAFFWRSEEVYSSLGSVHHCRAMLNSVYQLRELYIFGTVQQP